MARTSLQIVSANDLLDGDTVYWGTDGGWTRTLDSAVVVDKGTAADALLEAASVDQSLVVGPHVFAVDMVNGKPVPIHIRETLRCRRVPSVRPDLA